MFINPLTSQTADNQDVKRIFLPVIFHGVERLSFL